MPTVAAAPLRELARALLRAAGATPEHAAVVGDSLVDANLAGHDSHGVQLLPHYVESALSGDVDPAVEPTVTRRDRATATVDGAHGWGQPAMLLASRTAVQQARAFGVGAVVVNRCRHIGRVAPYVESIAAAGMIGLAVANVPPAVAPFGGRQRVLGTNPIAWAIPRAGGLPPICLDVATSAVAYGKVEVARARGVPVPAGALLDRDGTPTTDPEVVRDGGVLLPFGGHKGSGFAVFAQLIGMALAGYDTTGMDEIVNGNGPLILALDVGPFVDPELFLDRVERQSAAITGSTPLPGVDRVLLPGEPEIATRTRLERDGIALPDATWERIATTAAPLGVAMPGVDSTQSLDNGSAPASDAASTAATDVAPALRGRPSPTTGSRP